MILGIDHMIFTNGAWILLNTKISNITILLIHSFQGKPPKNQIPAVLTIEWFQIFFLIFPIIASGLFLFSDCNLTSGGDRSFITRYLTKITSSVFISYFSNVLRMHIISYFSNVLRMQLNQSLKTDPPILSSWLAQNYEK